MTDGRSEAGLEGVLHTARIRALPDDGVVGMMGTEGAGKVLGTEEREVVSHWEDLGLLVKV